MPDDEELGVVVERDGVIGIAELVPKSLIDSLDFWQLLIDVHVSTHLAHEIIIFFQLNHLLVAAFYHFKRINQKLQFTL